MMISSKASFGIEYEIDEASNMRMFGRLCYWIANQRVGNYDLPTSLRDVLNQMTSIVKLGADRVSEASWSVPAGECFRLIDKSMFGNISDAPPISDEMPARFDIKIPVDVFDEWKVFLVQHSTQERLLFAKYPFSDVDELILPKGSCDAALSKFFHDLDELIPA
jgi:immunity protein 42 of polymorphic toxin system